MQQQQLLETYTGKLDKIFPNGFTSWIETHHEVVSFITERLLEDQNADTQINRASAAGGTTGRYTLAEQWTDDFEQANAGREWDGEFFDEIEQFLATKNNTL